MVDKIRHYISRHKVEIGLLIVILLIASFFRLYRISDYMTFLGDEGRDAIVAKDILHGHFTLLGPRASAGDFFLGPIYYYMMAPFLLLSNYDPVGPAIMVALFGIATVFLVYYVGLRLFNSRAGLIAASLYAISPLVIAYSRSSWNPNPMPFFSILMLYLLYVGVKQQKNLLFIVVGVLLGVAMQLHYLSTFLAVIIFFFVAIGEFLQSKKKLLYRYPLHYFEILFGFVVGFSPFLVFEARHGFPNTKTILKFIFEENATSKYVNTSFVGNVSNVFFRIFGRLVTKFPQPEQVNILVHPPLLLLFIITILLSIASITSILLAKDKLKMLLLALWLIFGIVLFGIYKKPIYDYYFGFMFPVPFLLVGGLLSFLSNYKKNKIIQGCGYLIFAGLIVLNLSGAPFLFPANKQKEQAKNIANFVLSKTNGMPFNFALLTQGNSDHVYRYFFEIENRAPVTIENPSVDPQRKTVTDQLLIVCEYQNCQPLGNSLWEVAGFGRAQIAGEWDVPFVKIYRLVHYTRPQGYTLKNIWYKGLSTYTNPDLKFSMQYPESFKQDVLTDNHGYTILPKLNLLFETPQVPNEEQSKPGFDFQNYDGNTMRIYLLAYYNSNKLTLEDFFNKNFTGMYGPEKIIDRLNQGLQKTSIPKPDSYVFTGSLGEWPSKRYFFINQNYIFDIAMYGGNDTGAKFSDDAEATFDNMIKSMKFY